MARASSPEPVSIRLPRTYDEALLQRDLEAVKHVDQAPQPGPYHAGEWKGVALYSMGGQQSVFPSAPGLDRYQETAVLKHTPYFKAILDELVCPKEVVRILTLPPGGHIKDHYDFHTNFSYGLIRLHIPIVTHPDVAFVIDGQRVDWKEGELWYGDFAKVHSVKNDSPITRVHMVIDVQINEFVLGLFPADYVERRRAEGISMTREPISASEAELRRFMCDFQIPGEYLPMFTIGKSLFSLAKGSPAGVRLMDGQLVVLLDNKPQFRLEPIGGDTFSIAGLPTGITLQFREGQSRVEEVILNLKGLPADLYFARLGKPRGEAIPDRSVSLPLV
jgi:Aspartyl/Asparaginyl beta-hydroxylase